MSSKLKNVEKENVKSEIICSKEIILGRKVSPEDKSFLIEQYKVYVSEASKTSDRRYDSNKFFIGTIGSLITISMSSFVANLNWILNILGIFLSVAWLFAIESSKKLNTVKFDIILEIEEKLGVEGFKIEWENVKKIKYKKFTSIEKIVPFVMITLNMLLILIQITQLIFPIIRRFF